MNDEGLADVEAANLSFAKSPSEAVTTAEAPATGQETREEFSQGIRAGRRQFESVDHHGNMRSLGRGPRSA
jgi:hypothetical protein